MRTALVSSCYLEGKDPLGNNRLERNKRYLNYYSKLKDQMGFAQIILLDNASPKALIDELEVYAFSISAPLLVMRFKEHFPRGPGPQEYPYCWRALYALKDLMFYEKLIVNDSDGFILTRALASHIKSLDSGWVSFWCETWNFPEAALFVLCKDSYPIAKRYFETPWLDRMGCRMEDDIPFTKVERKFRCGRFGEKGAPPQDDTMDFYGQTPLTRDLEFGRFR